MNARNPKWKEYEDFVYDLLCDQHKDFVLERNIRVLGYKSNQKRQIDIAMRGSLAGHDVFVVIDCKCYSKKIDVKAVGEFAFFLDDVAADIGILVTTLGYTQAAASAAKKSRIKLDIKSLEELHNYRVRLDFCDECDPGEEHFPGVIWWGVSGVIGNIDAVAAIGRCDLCNSVHVRCLQCGSITGIIEEAYTEIVECTGGCGTTFSVRKEYSRKAEYDEILEVGQPEYDE